MAWADQLEFAGHTDWRLPTSLNLDGSGPDYGSMSPETEMGSLYYIEGVTANNFPSSFLPFFNNYAQFHFGQHSYWLAEEYNPSPTDAWDFDFGGGLQATRFKSSATYAWAVRDMAPVPEPSTMLLLGVGLLGLAGVRKKFKK